MTDLLLHGNAFVYLQRNQKAKIVGMRYVPANRVSIYYDEKKNTLHYRCDIICRGIIQPYRRLICKRIQELYQKKEEIKEEQNYRRNRYD